MTNRRRSAEEQDRHPADHMAAKVADALQAQDTRNPSAPGAETWTHARLRERIQQAGAALAPATDPAHTQEREPDHAPLADWEAEP
jgi:hypothetical protein